MITNNATETKTELVGLSTDPKPTHDGIPNGATFLEMNTGNVYIYDKANTIWRKI